jgi:hypothetical protein
LDLTLFPKRKSNEKTKHLKKSNEIEWKNQRKIIFPISFRIYFDIASLFLQPTSEEVRRKREKNNIKFTFSQRNIQPNGWGKISNQFLISYRVSETRKKIHNELKSDFTSTRLEWNRIECCNKTRLESEGAKWNTQESIFGI